MTDNEYDSQIEKIASMIILDKVSPDEQDPQKLQKYYDFAKSNFNLTEESSIQLVNESLLFIKLKNSDSVDPLQYGDKFGAGFS